jgi:hypothetical protein
MESMRELTNALEIAPYFNTDYNSELTREFPIGTSFQIPFPKQFLATNSLAYTPQPIIDRNTTVTVDQVSAVHFDWDSVEKALLMPRGEDKVRQQIIRPAMNTIRQDIESRCALYAYLNTPNVVGVLGTNPSSFDAVFGAAGQRLAELGYKGDLAMFLSPGVIRPLRASAVSYFNPSADLTAMWKKGTIGEANGFETYQVNSLYSHTAGTWAGTVEMASANQSGSTLSLTATTGDTFFPGDAFNIAGVYEVNPMTRRSTGTLKQFVVGGTATVTAASSAATIPIIPAIVGPGSPYQNVSALPANGADLTLFPGTSSPNGKSGTQGLALGRDAFALVGVRLPQPKEGTVEITSQARDPRTGISVAVIRDFDPILRRWVNRLDTLYGFGNLYNDRAAVRVLGA